MVLCLPLTLCLETLCYLFVASTLSIWIRHGILLRVIRLAFYHGSIKAVPKKNSREPILCKAEIS